MFSGANPTLAASHLITVRFLCYILLTYAQKWAQVESGLLFHHLLILFMGSGGSSFHKEGAEEVPKEVVKGQQVAAELTAKRATCPDGSQKTSGHTGLRIKQVENRQV